MRSIFIFIALLALSGCQSLILSSNSLIHKDNTVTVKNLELKLTIDESYGYLGEYEFSQFMKYSDTLQGGTIHNGKSIVYENKKNHSFVMIMKKTCNQCVFTPSSRIPESDGPSSFFIGSNRYYKRVGCANLTPKDEEDEQLIKLLMSSNNNGIYEGRFNYNGTTSGVNNSYFELYVASPRNKSGQIKIDDVVKMEAM
ncbi:hypothetical protein [Photobacterium chitinilyticum]|uniref:Lipoprotein n=1 Tax=Photobacterium chitinilyticum TaxID=2485123 RepID=A0A444JS36_9GAMM|nr:hypothetical protein [Photobacterium chitinilyticum]RWX55778.1 hypothetical protein EDI28_10610 [Photobacterium chitinilyticum]